MQSDPLGGKHQLADRPSSPISRELIHSVEGIAEEVYGEANKPTVRRIRHLIAYHNFPAKKVGGRWQALRSKIHEYYAD